MLYVAHTSLSLILRMRLELFLTGKFSETGSLLTRTNINFLGIIHLPGLSPSSGQSLPSGAQFIDIVPTSYLNCPVFDLKTTFRRQSSVSETSFLNKKQDDG
jgi:hypothetical protein